MSYFQSLSVNNFKGVDSTKNFDEWKNKTNKAKHENKIPLINLKVTAFSHNTFMTSLVKLL